MADRADDDPACGVKRYSMCVDDDNKPYGFAQTHVESFEDDEGEWVRFEDYEALRRERDALLARLAVREE